MRGFYCKHHNKFLYIREIEEDKQGRCWSCKHFIKIHSHLKNGKKYK